MFFAQMSIRLSGNWMYFDGLKYERRDKFSSVEKYSALMKVPAYYCEEALV
jgi:hypothetical protein